MSRVQIPADVDRPDEVMLGLTARQLAVLATGAGVAYAGWWLTRAVVPLPVYLAVVCPLLAGLVALVLVRRDGMSGDRLVWAALRYRLTTRRQVAHPAPAEPVPGWVKQAATDHTDTPHAEVALPAHGIDEAGVVDLGREGWALVAVCSTVNFALRSHAEQEALVACFGRWLHSLTSPVQVLVRTERVEVGDQIRTLQNSAARMPHPALQQAAEDHAVFLAELAARTDLLRRQVLLVLREPHPTPTTPRRRRLGRTPPNRAQPSGADPSGQAAGARLARRAGEAADVLAAAGITVTPLDTGRAAAVLAVACDPDRTVGSHTDLASPGDVITTTPQEDP